MARQCRWASLPRQHADARAVIKDDHPSLKRPTPRQLRGQHAEDLALAHLQRQGLRLVLRNYRCRLGEIDLVLLDGSTLVLAEVRYRSSGSHGGAAASVTHIKQQRLIRAAQHLLMTRHDLRRYPVRFDVLAVSPAADQPRIDWIRQAFLA